MEKEYKLPQENNESEDGSSQNNAEEPAVSYNKRFSEDKCENVVLQDQNRPGLFCDKEKLDRIDHSIKELEAGVYFTHEQVLEKFKKRL